MPPAQTHNPAKLPSQSSHPKDTSNRITRPVWAAVAALLVLYACVAITASTHKGLSFDEGEELAVGYDIWLRHDFRMEAANGDFIKRWATLPFLISRPNFPDTDNEVWRAGSPYGLGYLFFFKDGNRPESLLLQGRIMVTLLGLATGLMIFFCSREIFGNIGGLVSLGAFALSPHMLAFGALVSTEMSICLGLLGSVWCIWRLLHRVTWCRLLGSLGFIGLLVLAKPTAFIIFPVSAVLLVVRLAAGPPLEWRLGGERIIRSRIVQTVIFCGLILLHVMAAWVAVWAQYDFRYAASPDPADPGVTFHRLSYRDPVNPKVEAALTWSRDAHFLPQGYVRGIDRLLRHNEDRLAFMNGRWRIGAWRIFFPYAFWVKTPPALLLLFLLGLGGWWWRNRRKQNSPGTSGADASEFAPAFYKTVPYFTLIIVYFGIAIIQNLNIGHRHILPVYPPLYILAGAAGLIWPLRTSWKWTNLAPVLLILWLAYDSLAMYPHFLAYFSPLAGGPRHGYRHLVDSSLDWGMDLPGLKRWDRRHNPAGREPLYLAYFGTDRPKYYGITCHRLPGFFDWRRREVYALKPGIYAISATLLQSIYTQTYGPWNKVYEKKYQECLKNFATLEDTADDPAQRAALLEQYPRRFWNRQYDILEKLRFGRLCAWLRHHGDPPDSVGYSILIWKLDQKDLTDALLGPPAELKENPIGG